MISINEYVRKKHALGPSDDDTDEAQRDFNMLNRGDGGSLPYQKRIIESGGVPAGNPRNWPMETVLDFLAAVGVTPHPRPPDDVMMGLARELLRIKAIFYYNGAGGAQRRGCRKNGLGRDEHARV